MTSSARSCSCFPDGITMQVAAFTALDAAVAIPGFAGARRPNDYPGRHTCLWRVPDDEDVTVRLAFTAGIAPTPFQAGANANPVAGRVDAACQAATAVATIVWPKLPTPLAVPPGP